MDVKINREKEEIYINLGIPMPYKAMCFYYNGETLYKRMLVDILTKKWKPKEKVVMACNRTVPLGLDYSNCKIYRIVSKNTNKVYIGSTIFEIEDRLTKHFLDYNFYLKYRYNYCTSYEILQMGCISIELLEDKIVGKDKMYQKESEFITKKLDMCVNIKDPWTNWKLRKDDVYTRTLVANRFMINLVCNVIKDKMINITSMEDMYKVYIDKKCEIMELKTKMDENYYVCLTEYYRLKNIEL